jgi:hypothetical protein
MKVPKVKKTVKAFLLEEDGKISKQAVVAVGSIIAAGAAASLAAKSAQAGTCTVPTTPQDTQKDCWDHTNGVSNPSGTMVAHNHHYNHGSHYNQSHSNHDSGW